MGAGGGDDSDWAAVAARDTARKIALVCQSFQVLLCWAAERFLLARERLPDLQTHVCVIVFLGCFLIEWAGPLPRDDTSTVLYSQKAGCDGGFRALFTFFYAPLWVTALSFGVLLLNCIPGDTEDSDDEPLEDDDSEDGHLVQRTRRQLPNKEDELTPRVFRRLALPLLHGFATTMAALVLASGMGSEDPRPWFGAGCLMLGIALCCALDWTLRLGLSLGTWGPVSQCAQMLLGLLQGHLLYRDYRWPVGHGLGFPFLSEHEGVWFYLTGFTFLLAVALMYALTTEWREWTKSTAAHAMDARGNPTLDRSLSRARTFTEEVMSRTRARTLTEEMMSGQTFNFSAMVAVSWRWVLLPFCFGCYAHAITMPLFHYHLCAPDVQWLQGQAAMDQFHDARGRFSPERCAVNKMGFVEQIGWYYEHSMPFSAMLAAYSSVVGPPLEFCALCLAFLQPLTSAVPPLIMRALQDWLSNAAATKFATPMLYMLGVTMIQFADPGGNSFRAEFTRGFAFMMAYCFTFGVLVRTVEPKPDKSAAVAVLTTEEMPQQVSRGMSRNNDSDSSDDSSDDDGFLLRGCEDMGWWLQLLGATCLFTLVAVAMYTAITTPLMSFDVRYSDALVLQFHPTLLDLWHTLLEVNVPCAVFAAFSLVFSLLLRIPLLLLRRTFFRNHSTKESFWTFASLVRNLERLAKHFTLGHVWAEAIVLVWLYIITRHKEVYQLCARLPTPPVGLVAIAVMGVGIPSFSHIAEMIALTPFSPGRRLDNLPGGLVAWGLAPASVFGFWVFILYTSGPVVMPEITHLGDLNRVLSARVLPMTNEQMRKALPESQGDCVELWAHCRDSGVCRNMHPNCKGKAPLAHMITESGWEVSVLWATGLNEVNITDLRVLQPTQAGRDTKSWILSASGVFTDLKVWVKAVSGTRVWINDNLCCDKDFKFTIQASTTCDDDEGFGPVHVELARIDRPELGNTVKSWSSPSSEGFIKIDYGDVNTVSNKDVQKYINDFLSGGEGNLMMKNSEGEILDVFEFARAKLQDVVRLNTGRMCP